MRILGVSGSLRNARFGRGSERFVDEIKTLGDEAALHKYLEDQTKIRLEDFVAAGSGEKRPFDEIYKALLKAKGDRGLSNSEAALAAGLWGAVQGGADIEHCGLSTFFPMSGTQRNLHALRELVLRSDGLLVSGPVYFGDRGSLAQEFFEFLHDDPACAAHVRDKLYAGIAVGAKRNGGQETTLIYQLVDATNMNMLAVGNDSATTSQYGGTAHAGDIGTLHADKYGISTSLGTGRRLATVGRMLEDATRARLADKARIHVWLLQDTRDHHGREAIARLMAQAMTRNPNVEISVVDLTDRVIYRCIACDICPTHLGKSEEYRCIIGAEADVFKQEHADLIDVDAILLAAYSPVDRREANSVYQRFTERTRYFRHDDYVIGDRLVAPLVISEVNANQNLHIRMLTSFLRHHTVLHHPLIGVEYSGEILNWNVLAEQADSFCRNAVRLTVGRLVHTSAAENTTYNPLGYEISRQKQMEDLTSGRQAAVQQLRVDRHRINQSGRLEPALTPTSVPYEAT